MKQFSPGRYKTLNGAFAIVKKLVMAGGEWYLSGAVGADNTNLLLLCSWNLQGQCVTDGRGTDRFQLVDND